VFGLAIPHAWARYAGAKVIDVTFAPMMALRYLLAPAVAAIQAFDVPIRRLAGVSEDAEDEVEAAKQEIMQAATDGAAEGNVASEEVEMIASVIELSDSQAGEIMTPRTDLFALPAQTNWQEACQKIVAAGHTRVPIYEGDLDNIIGILYAKDLLGFVGGPVPTELRAVVRKPFFVPETKPLDDLLREFRVRKVHMAVVLDEYGGTAGVVTIEDVLEEIVGEIADEYDLSEPALMRRIDETTAEVDGRMYIDDLNEAMDLEIPEDKDYSTVAGMVFSELGYIPKVGEVLVAFGARFTVLAADERKITRLKVEWLEEQKEEPL
jgi:CBS domain containing-hemolysin-like protein